MSGGVAENGESFGRDSLSDTKPGEIKEKSAALMAEGGF